MIARRRPVFGALAAAATGTMTLSVALVIALAAASPAVAAPGEVARQYDIPFPPHVDDPGSDPM